MALPEMQSAAHPFVKPKWDERAYFMVQDALYGRMDDGVINYDVGSSDLLVLAVIRATCSRSGAVGKDAFDLSGAISKWSRDGENVIRCAPPCLASTPVAGGWREGGGRVAGQVAGRWLARGWHGAGTGLARGWHTVRHEALDGAWTGVPDRR